jgi:hypothetical protein
LFIKKDQVCYLKNKIQFVFFPDKSRASIIQCLASLMLQDVLKKQNLITEECRDELKFELLQRVC